MNNFTIIIIDGIGIGELEDAEEYGDKGANTLLHIAEANFDFNLPNLAAMGLGNIIEIPGMNKTKFPLASFGKMKEISKGKDSTTGHWEIGGIRVNMDFPYYPNGFPKELVEDFMKHTGVKGILGNIPASGTEIIEKLGEEHLRSGFPIIYTSADSVFQIAAHQEIIPLSRLYEMCLMTREKVCINEHAVGRVIARPFIGSFGDFKRTANRKDYSLDPPSDTILDVLYKNNIKTIAIGKINDLFNYRGIKESIITKSNADGVKAAIELQKNNKHSFIFANLVDFDVYYGHRNDPIGFYRALKEFDAELPNIVGTLDESDALIITSDHGNDPSDVSTDHTREYVPLLFYRKGRPGVNLGVRQTFSDAAKTVADYYRVDNDLCGTSFLNSA